MLSDNIEPPREIKMYGTEEGGMGQEESEKKN